MTTAIVALQNISFSNPNKKILENTRKKKNISTILFSAFVKKNTDFLKQGQSLHCVRDQFTYDF